MSDFDFTMDVSGLGEVLDKTLESDLERALINAKPNILKNLPGSISKGIMESANAHLVQSIVSYHEHQTCPVSTLDPVNAGFSHVVNVSRVCINNNGGFALKWSYANCPAHSVSKQTDPFPADVMTCMDVQSMFPSAKPGEILRVQTEAIAGVHEIIDPALRYMPDSYVAASFECGRSTLLYNCDFVSVAPIDPSIPPQVEHVCIINQAGFDMNFDSQDLRTNSWVGRSSIYPVNQRQCINLGQLSGVHDGDRFRTLVQAIGGVQNPVDRLVKYRKNNFTATFQCKGSTTMYDCKLAVGPPLKPVIPQVASICIRNSAGFAMFFDVLDQRTKAAGRSSTYPNPQMHCVDLKSISGVKEGDEFQASVQAIAGANKQVDGLVEYSDNNMVATYQCTGSTMIFGCKLQGVGLTVFETSTVYV